MSAFHIIILREAEEKGWGSGGERDTIKGREGRWGGGGGLGRDSKIEMEREHVCNWSKRK